MKSSVCITSILRMSTLKTGSKATDITYGTLNSTIWTTIEANTAIICACLPMLKAPLAAMFPSLFPRGSSSPEYSSGSGPYFRHTPHSRNGWSHTRSGKASESTSGENLKSSQGSAGVDGQDTGGMEGANMQMGLITKTTHVDVKFNGRDRSNASSPRRTSSTYPRTLSEAHLAGGPDRNMM